jgi:hypothetical protein
MTETASTLPAAASPDSTGAGPGPGLVGRLVGIVTSPRETYAVVARDPPWLVVALVVRVMTFAPTAWFQTTEVGRQAALDQAVRATEAFGITVTDQMYAEMEMSTLDAPAWRLLLNMVFGVIFAPVIWAAVAGLLYALMTVMGGNARFKQVFAVVVHSSIITAIGAAFATPIYYLRESASGVTNLAVFLPMLPEGSFLARFLGMVDLFWIWWVFSLSVGLAVLYRRKTTSVAIPLYAIYAVIALGIAAFLGLRSAA